MIPATVLRSRCTAIWLLFVLASPAIAGKRQQCAALPADKPQLYGYNVVGEFAHDPTGFTQGLVFDTRCYADEPDCREIFFESTGMYGESDVRISHVDTGLVEAATKMERKWFGEGLARRGDFLYQIVWQKPDGFIYSARDLRLVGSFKTPLSDGWGITNDGDLLVISDGSARLTWVDPDKGFGRVKTLEVRVQGRRLNMLNELEMIKGEIWANVWQTECIARICPQTGNVTGWVLMHGLSHALKQRNLPMGGKSMDVLNGIAYDASRQRLFVTGKYWPRVFEVSIHAINPNLEHNKRLADSCWPPPLFGF